MYVKSSATFSNKHTRSEYKLIYLYTYSRKSSVGLGCNPALKRVGSAACYANNLSAERRGGRAEIAIIRRQHSDAGESLLCKYIQSIYIWGEKRSIISRRESGRRRRRPAAGDARARERNEQQRQQQQRIRGRLIQLRGVYTRRELRHMSCLLFFPLPPRRGQK